MASNTSWSDEDRLLSAVVYLNAKVLGLALGAILGLGVFIATNWLVLKGGYTTASGQYVVGPHLQLLSQFFIGYKVSFTGSIVGLLYGFAIGTFCGATIGWIYNSIVLLRKRIKW